MAKTLVEKNICESCGAEARAGSLFCYNCGKAVAAEARGEREGNQQKTVKEALLEESLKDQSDFKTTRLNGEVLEKASGTPIPKPENADEPKLKSAASLRRKPKSFQKKTVEIVWEEPDNAPNKWFPLVALGLVLFVLLIFYLAMYLK